MVRLAGALIAVLLFALPAVARASVTVNTTSDHAPDTCDAQPAGDCTLREAINNPPLDGLIIVPAGTYNIDSQLIVDGDMTIQGAGARTTVIRYANPDLQDRVMLIESGLSSVSVSGVTITGGNAPGSQG